MSFDRVIDSSKLDNALTATADAIRSKSGRTDKLEWDESTGFASDVNLIISRSYKSIVEKTITELRDESIELVGDYVFQQCLELTHIDLPNALSIGSNAFKTCTAIGYLNLPSVTTVGDNAFSTTSTSSGSSLLATLSLPSVITLGISAFAGRTFSSIDLPVVEVIESSAFESSSPNTRIKRLVFPKCRRISQKAFYRYNALEYLDIGNAQYIGAQTFMNAYALKYILLRGTEMVCTLTNTNAFSGCYHLLGTVNSTHNPEGLTDGYIYVPSALLEEYKLAPNWSTYASQFRSLEEYTIDGTVTGELDISKI